MKACFFDEIHENYFRMALERSVARPAVSRVDPSNPCYIILAQSSIAKTNEIFKNKLIFLPTYFVFTLQFFAFFGSQNMFLHSLNSLLTGNQHFYLSKGIDSKLRNAIDELWAVPLLEQGYMKKTFDLLEIKLANEFPNKITIFMSVSEYVAANTFVRDLGFNEFKAFFYLHILLLLLFSTAQTLFLWSKFVLKVYQIKQISVLKKKRSI